MSCASKHGNSEPMLRTDTNSGVRGARRIRPASLLVLSAMLLALLLLPALAQRRPPEEVAPPAPKPTAVELRKESFRELKKAAENLLKAADELGKALDKPGAAPNDLIAAKAAEIEKHAKRIQAKLIGF